MKILIKILVVIVVVVGGAFVYFTRPVEGPSSDISNNVDAVLNNEEDDRGVYRIVSAESQVRFSIDEVLRGEEFTAVGVTNQIGGEILFDPEDPTNIEIGTVKVNARTLKTDSTQRDGAIARLILNSEEDENEFIEFQPTSVVANETEGGIELTITGNLTISGISQEVVFNGLIQVEDDNLNAYAAATVMRSDFDLNIPNVPFVADVSNEVLLEVQLVAEKVSE